MLATRLQKEFPELKHIQNVSVMEFKKMKKDDYQLVISTIPIPDYESNYIVVNPFLNVDEIEKIRSFINEYKILSSTEKSLPGNFNANLSKKSTAKLIEELHDIQEYAGTIGTILKGFEVNEVSGNNTSEEILNQVCQTLFKQQKIDQVVAVVQAVLERERLGGIGIPETRMALFHAHSPHVKEPIFTISNLPTPIRVMGMDEHEMDITFLVLLLSPSNPSEKVLEVLSYVSSLLIESDETIIIFQSNSYVKIVELLTVKLNQFFNKQLNELRSV
jgi:mannitol operon transcriptional antiterminator